MKEEINTMELKDIDRSHKFQLVYEDVVKLVVMAVYHCWMDASPSNYPPNLHPRVLSKDGSVYKRDYAPLISIGHKEYLQFRACDAKFVETIWEFTPNGRALVERMVLKIAFRPAEATYWSFGSCNSCWKWGRRNFTDNAITGHPLSVPSDDPTLPRLGRCGCVVCNECIMELEMNKANSDKMEVHCPYCRNEECFCKHMRIWVVSKEVSSLEK